MAGSDTPERDEAGPGPEEPEATEASTDTGDDAAAPEPQEPVAAAAPAPRGSRRDEARRRRYRRRRLTVAAVVLLVVAGGLGAFFATRDDGSVAKAAPPSTAKAVAGPADDVSSPPLRSATTKGGPITVYPSPDASGTPVETLSPKTEYLLPRTLLAYDTYGDFVHVYLPTRPNGSTGWVKASDVTLSAPLSYEITVNLGEHEVTVLKNGATVLTAPAAIGTPDDPTPRGLFYTTDPLDLSSEPNTAYGVFAIGLSGHSNVLTEFAGGDGQIAIHGTNDPGTIGQDVSHGCVRVNNDIIKKLALLPLGTPVVIT